MSDIKTVAIDKYNLMLQIVCGVLIILAYAFSKSLMWIAGIISFVYIFSSAKWEQKFAFFAFMLLFMPIFKISLAKTSLFVFLKAALVLCFAFKNSEKFSFSYVMVMVAFFAYSMILSEFFQTDYLVSLINIVLWILVGYVMVNTLSIETTLPVARSLSNAVIITGILGLFIGEIPFFGEEFRVVQAYAEDGALIVRHAGFFDDPNFFTVLAISSLWFIYYEFEFKKINITEFLTRSMLVSFVGLFTMSKSCVLLLIIFWIFVLLSKNSIQVSYKVVITFALVIASSIFLIRNPYWLSDVLFRFKGSGSELDTNTLTTGRSDIWDDYITTMLDNFSWIFGNGLNKKYLNGAASHNTIIQFFYNFGIMGSVLYIMMFRYMYNSAKTRNQYKTELLHKMAFFSIILSLMFLDMLTIEMFYYMIAMSFVYMLGNNSKNVQIVDDNELL